jgi:hypothetical protein
MAPWRACPAPALTTCSSKCGCAPRAHASRLGACRSFKAAAPQVRCAACAARGACRRDRACSRRRRPHTWSNCTLPPCLSGPWPRDAGRACRRARSGRQRAHVHAAKGAPGQVLCHGHARRLVLARGPRGRGPRHGRRHRTHAAPARLRARGARCCALGVGECARAPARAWWRQPGTGTGCIPRLTPPRSAAVLPVTHRAALLATRWRPATQWTCWWSPTAATTRARAHTRCLWRPATAACACRLPVPSPSHRAAATRLARPPRRSRCASHTPGRRLRLWSSL